jgi:uncharacterized protein (DUF983 family)
MKKGSKLYSIIKFKCPHCHEGDFFKSRNPYNLSSMAEPHEKCSNCNEKFSMEPGFYYGAMYVSYGLGCAHIITFWVARVILGIEPEFWNFIILVGVCLALLTPLYYAISKIVWANFFFQYKNKSI